MKLEEVVAALSRNISSGLPGESAQLKMAPAHRLSSAEYVRIQLHRTGCVLALLFPEKLTGEAKIVLIHRTSSDSVHGGQISFPGGKQEEQDASLLHTALRETEEEIGVISSTVKIIGALTELYIPPSNFLVHPFIGYVEEEPVFIPSEREVNKIITPFLNFFSNPENVHREKFASARGFEVDAPYYALNEYKIWGATAMMISEISALL